MTKNVMHAMTGLLMLLLTVSATWAQDGSVDGTYSVKESWSLTVTNPNNNKVITRTGVASGSVQVVGGSYNLVNKTGALINGLGASLSSNGGTYQVASEPVLYAFASKGTEFYAVVKLSFNVVLVPLGTTWGFSLFSSDDDYSASGTSLSHLVGSGTAIDGNGIEYDVSSVAALSGGANTPAPKISATPASVNFASVKVGGSSLKTVTIKNTGTVNVDLGLITFTDPQFVLQTNNCPNPLLPQSSCTVSVTFTPALPYGNKSATMNIPSNAPTATVKLSGKAPPPVISASPMSVKLTASALDIPSAAATVKIKNTGVSDLNINSVTITGTNASLFAVADTWVSPLPSGESCTVDVTFTPDSTGTKNASLVIASDDPKKSQVTVKLIGIIKNFTTTDLAGIWTGSRLKTSALTQVWQRETLTVQPNGTFAGPTVDSDGNTGTSSGKLSMSSDGKITYQGSTSLSNMDAGKTVIASTNTAGSSSTQLAVFTTNNGASYTVDDLVGKWNGNFISAGSGTNSWTRMIFSILPDGDGALTGGTSVNSDGNTGTPSGSFSISPDGILTWSEEPNMLCSMDAGKTVIACTDTPDSGIVDMAVFTKSGASYTAADLAGTWAMNGLATGPSAPCWLWITLTVKPDGTYTSQKTYYDGTTKKKSTKSGSGTVQISADGLKFSSDKSNNLLCQVDADETVIGCTETWDDGSTALSIFTRGLK